MVIRIATDSRLRDAWKPDRPHFLEMRRQTEDARGWSPQEASCLRRLSKSQFN